MDSHGHPLHLLAQINFAEVPHLEPFPRKGLLQFYISDIADDDLWGMNCERPDAPEMQCEDMLLQHGFRVIYFPEVVTDLDQLVLLDLPKPEYLPINQECNLSFELRQEYVPETDILFSKVLRNQLFERDGQHNGTLWHAYCDAINANGAKLGGYAAFCQDDPRVLLPDPLDWLLLFQMDSEDGEGYSILWGDGGVANFFIRRAALERCDFSQVLYNWDC